MCLTIRHTLIFALSGRISLPVLSCYHTPSRPALRVRYLRAASGLYEYVQIFVISNGTNTKYYSNTTRFNHIKEQERSKSKGKKTSNSFEFSSFWTDSNNKVINDLIDFTRTFFAKHTLINVITKSSPK